MRDLPETDPSETSPGPEIETVTVSIALSVSDALRTRTARFAAAVEEAVASAEIAAASDVGFADVPINAVV